LLKEKLDPNNIMKQVIDAAISFLTEALIKQVSARIILLFNPVGAIAQAVEAIYRVLKWIFENAARLFTLVETVVNGIANVIAGNIGGMAAAIEMALAQVIVPVIDFLADYASLGDLPLKIADVIKGFQDWVEGILDTVIGWLVEQGKKLLAAIGLGSKEKNKPDERSPEEKQRDLGLALGESNVLLKGENKSITYIKGKLHAIKDKYNMSVLELVIESETNALEIVHVHGEINPNNNTESQQLPKEHPDKKNVVVENGKFMLHPNLRGKNLRNKLYGKSYRTTIYAWKKLQLSNPPPIGIQDPANSSNYLWNDQSFPNKRGLSYPTIEHKGNGVIGHWNSEGRNTNQQSRKDFFNNKDDLEIMPLSINSSKGAILSGTANHEVTENFRGPGAAE
jgi:hypothetical protein